MTGKSHDDATVEGRIGYRFRDPRLLETALTHPSYRHEHADVADDYQRLEFLGDAVLGLLLADQLYRERETADEGELTILRSQCASGRALGGIAREIGLQNRLRLGRSAATADKRQAVRQLAAGLEAVLGAVWLDGGWEAVRAVYARLFHGRMAALDRNPWADNPKGELQAWAQAHGHPNPVYTVVAVDGPTHAPCYVVAVEVAGRQASGQGGGKQRAESAAAAAWLRLQEGNDSNSQFGGLRQ